MKNHYFHIHCVYNVYVNVKIVTMTMSGAASNYSREAEDTMTDEVTREAMFLVGSKSRFGRAVRFNNRFVQ